MRTLDKPSKFLRPRVSNNSLAEESVNLIVFMDLRGAWHVNCGWVHADGIYSTSAQGSYDQLCYILNRTQSLEMIKQLEDCVLQRSL